MNVCHMGLIWCNMGAHYLQQYTVITVEYGATWVLTHLLAALVILSVEGDYPLLQGVYDEARPKHWTTLVVPCSVG